MTPKCRVCGCTDHDGCAIEVGCMWVAPDLCSTCYEMAEHLASFFVVAGAKATRGDPTIFQRVIDEAFALLQAEAEPGDGPKIVIANELDMRVAIAEAAS